MDKLSDYLPFVIIVASLVISAVGKKKKSDKEVSQKTTLPGKTVQEYVEKRKLQPVLADPYQKISDAKPKKPAMQSQVIAKETAPSPPMPLILEPEEEGNSFFTFEEEDDLKRAIIYSEIINRREY